MVDEKIATDFEGIRRIKLDIGLSYSAPQSQVWLSRENDLLVFGFEPVQESVDEIRRGAIKRDPSHGTPLDLSHISSGRFQLIPCALGAETGIQDFFVTANDVGCSSLFTPISFAVLKKVQVPVYTLRDFFDLFPFDRFPFIDHIKIDAQGADLDILKGAGDYLKKRVVFITIEPENNRYENTHNSMEEIVRFMEHNGFSQVFTEETDDPTFLNVAFKDYPHLYSIHCYQRG